jgi:hypothetical protein
VAKHRDDLPFGQLLLERVEQNDPPQLPHAGEVGVRMRRTARAVDGENAGHLELNLLGQGGDRFLQVSIRQRRELVEDRREEGRIDRRHEKFEAVNRSEGPEPPQSAAF